MQKPIATNLETARKMIETARKAGIVLGVVSQHRFDDSSQFLKKAIADGRLGKILQADAYVKWHRTAEYYSRPIKGSWATEGGGALINQAVHQVDVLLWLSVPFASCSPTGSLGALHKIESEDVISALLRYENGATGCDSGLHRVLARLLGAPGDPRHERHRGDYGRQADHLGCAGRSAASPATREGSACRAPRIPWRFRSTPFERQFLDFGEACKTGRTSAGLRRRRIPRARSRRSPRTNRRGAAKRFVTREVRSDECMSRVRVPASSANLGPGFRCPGARAERLSGLPFPAQRPTCDPRQRARRG